MQEKKHAAVSVVSLFTTFLIISFLPIHAFSLTDNSSSDSLIIREVERYFDDLTKDFDKVSKSSILRGTKLKPIDRHFVVTLKKHQTIHSLLRTNSKGIVISEVVRGQIPKGVDKRNLSKQAWFSATSTKQEEYYDLIKNEETGRYYLFWAKPVMAKSGASKQHFIGAVVVQIDLWDCFREIATDIDQPFLIRLNKISLYSNKWEKQKNTVETALEIPGVKKISVCYSKPKPATAIETPVAPAVSPAAVTQVVKPVAPATPDSLLQKQPSKTSKSGNGKVYIIIICIAIIVVFFIVLTKFLQWYRRKMNEDLMNKL